jgi:hypothetical protein
MMRSARQNSANNVHLSGVQSPDRQLPPQESKGESLPYRECKGVECKTALNFFAIRITDITHLLGEKLYRQKVTLTAEERSATHVYEIKMFNTISNLGIPNFLIYSFTTKLFFPCLLHMLKNTVEELESSSNYLLFLSLLLSVI